MAGNLAAFAIINASASITIGECLYINAMVRDMKTMLNDDESSGPMGRMESWSTYVREVRFHIEVIGLVYGKFDACHLGVTGNFFYPPSDRKVTVKIIDILHYYLQGG